MASHEPFAEIRDMSFAASPSSETPPSAPAASGEKTTAASTEFISFAIGDEQYGVDIMAVREIKGWSGVTQLPNQPEYMRGVLNLRGVMVPIVDLRCRFGQGLTEATPVHIVIVVQVDKKTVGLLADRVLDIISVEAAQIQPVPQVSRSMRADFLSGLVTIDETMIALIDLDRLLADRDSEAATAA
ncbi:MAG TPA: chemotaxis protein CheW [Xanthobacteraceae bacterium]|nr:chemotaxis protein CheW [Xanthobacteraceae bacterium]